MGQVVLAEGEHLAATGSAAALRQSLVLQQQVRVAARARQLAALLDVRSQRCEHVQLADLSVQQLTVIAGLGGGEGRIRVVHGGVRLGQGDGSGVGWHGGLERVDVVEGEAVCGQALVGRRVQLLGLQKLTPKMNNLDANICEQNEK